MKGLITLNFSPQNSNQESHKLSKAVSLCGKFENFLKFAERKELKDRLKELDPPPMTNYVDPSTIDNIAKARKKPPLAGSKQVKKGPINDAGEEHRRRIN